MGTHLVQAPDCAMTVITTVLSVYPARSEALCDAGALALSKDTGPLPGYGIVVEPADLKGWIIGRTSQEHGILTHDGTPKRLPNVGEQLRVIPQHACLAASQFPYFLVVNGAQKVDEVWHPAKFWL
jgi:D-serine deaminase-like pyridoxal phosphate-dependent protein